MIFNLTTNCCTRIVNLHPTFFDKPEMFDEKVKTLARDLAIGQKIKQVTVEKDGIQVYSFSSGQLKDSEEHHEVSVGLFAGHKPGNGTPKFLRDHSQKAEKINFMR